MSRRTLTLRVTARRLVEFGALQHITWLLSAFQQCVLLLTALTFAGNCAAVQTAQVKDLPALPATVTVDQKPLLLNGVTQDGPMNIRAAYVALYLVSKQTKAETVIAMPGPKRLTLQMQRDVSGRDMSDTFLDRLRQNLTRQERNDNFSTILQFGSLFTESRAKFFRGDIVNLDYYPSTKSTLVFINGVKVGDPIIGETFFPILLQTWIGPKMRPSLRDELLGLKLPG